MLRFFLYLRVLIDLAKAWLFDYVSVKQRTFSGQINIRNKTILHWRIKPEIRSIPKDNERMYHIYFRVYIDTEGY